MIQFNALAKLNIYCIVCIRNRIECITGKQIISNTTRRCRWVEEKEWIDISNSMGIRANRI